jgi:hypothetical protein
MKQNDMEDSKYIIVCVNTAHPSGELKYFLATDNDDNTLVYDNRQAATDWVLEAENVNLPFAYSILDTGDLDFSL